MKRSRPRWRDAAPPHPARLQVIRDSAGGGWREKMSAEKEGSWQRQIETGCWFLWKTVSFLSSHVWREPVPCPPPPHHASLHFHAHKRGAGNCVFVEKTRGGRVWWYSTVFLFFWEVAIGSFEGWDWLRWCGGGGGTRRYQLPHCHLTASWLVNTVCWGWKLDLERRHTSLWVSSRYRAGSWWTCGGGEEGG